MKEIYLNFDYKFTSCTGNIEGLRYIQRINVDIYASGIDDDEKVLIGKETIKFLLLNQALEDGVCFAELMDSDPDLFFIEDRVYNLDAGELNTIITDKYLEASLNTNICVLDRLVLRPEYRGLGIAKKIIKDTIHQFTACCGLFVIYPFPLQFEGDHCLGADPWEDKSWNTGLEKNEKKAFKLLTSYFQTLGFHKIKGISELLFFCPYFRNDKLDKVSLNEAILMR